MALVIATIKNVIFLEQVNVSWILKKNLKYENKNMKIYDFWIKILRILEMYESSF